jgi:hypothetical protein
VQRGRRRPAWDRRRAAPRSRSGEVGGRAGDGGVDALRALRAAGDQQHRAVGGQPELAAGSGAGGGAVERGDGRAQRDAEHLGAAQPAALDGGRDVPGGAGADAVGQPGTRVRLVHDGGVPRRRAAR